MVSKHHCLVLYMEKSSPIAARMGAITMSCLSIHVVHSMETRKYDRIQSEQCTDLEESTLFNIRLRHRAYKLHTRMQGALGTGILETPRHVGSGMVKVLPPCACVDIKSIYRHPKILCKHINLPRNTVDLPILP